MNLTIDKSKSFYLSDIVNRNLKFSFKKNKKVILFGAAILGKVFAELCLKNKLEIINFCDNDKSKNKAVLNGIEIISIEELQKHPKNTPIIITILHDFVVKDQLKKLGFTHVWSHTYFATFYPKKFRYFYWWSSINEIFKDKQKIYTLYSLLSDKKSKNVLNQLIQYRLRLDNNCFKKIIDPLYMKYFDQKIIKLSEKEIFIDGGAFTGDSIKDFIKKTKNHFKSIHSFEPDKITYSKLKKYTKKLNDPRIKIHRLGLGSKYKILSFTNDGTVGSKIDIKAKSYIQTTALDNFSFKEIPTIIKLDIEGFEIQAINGMKKILSKYKPKLIICLYHKPRDLWQIPLLIKKINPAYKLYLRHYTSTHIDTICYAI